MTRTTAILDETFDPADLCWLPAREVARLVRERRVSAVELLDAHLERIEQQNGAINAVVSMDAERAREQAVAVDATLARGESVGSLCGVPMTLKDGIDVAGLRSTVGTFELDRVARHDSAVAARLRGAGAIVFGHTNVAQWLADHQTMNPVFGRTANPWDHTRTAGGSSGGAAAAVATGMSALEVGSDMAGSTRIPASFCGVYGLKTTEHRVPLTGFFLPADAGPRSVRIIATLGPIARDLDDLELGLRVIGGPDGRDGDVPAVPLVNEPLRGVRGLEGMRLAVAPTVPGTTVSSAVRDEIARVAAQASDSGAIVDERLPVIDWDELSELFESLIGTITRVFDPSADLTGEHRTLAWYLDALDRRDRLIARWHEFFTDVDAILCPVTATTAFAHQEPGVPFTIDGQTVDYGVHGGLNGFSNLCGLPGLSLPAGSDANGLPIGVQLVGPAWSELRLLAIARSLVERGILPGFRRPPEREQRRHHDGPAERQVG